jgi:hypothetical protein
MGGCVGHAVVRCRPRGSHPSGSGGGLQNANPAHRMEPRRSRGGRSFRNRPVFLIAPVPTLTAPPAPIQLKRVREKNHELCQSRSKPAFCPDWRVQRGDSAKAFRRRCSVPTGSLLPQLHSPVVPAMIAAESERYRQEHVVAARKGGRSVFGRQKSRTAKISDGEATSASLAGGRLDMWSNRMIARPSARRQIRLATHVLSRSSDG